MEITGEATPLDPSWQERVAELLRTARNRVNRGGFPPGHPLNLWKGAMDKLLQQGQTGLMAPPEEPPVGLGTAALPDPEAMSRWGRGDAPYTMGEAGLAGRLPMLKPGRAGDALNIAASLPISTAIQAPAGASVVGALKKAGTKLPEEYMALLSKVLLDKGVLPPVLVTGPNGLPAPLYELEKKGIYEVQKGRVFTPKPQKGVEPKFVQQVDPLPRWYNAETIPADKEQDAYNWALSTDRKVFDGLRLETKNPENNKYVVFDDAQVFDIPKEPMRLPFFHGGEPIEEVDRPLWLGHDPQTALSYKNEKADLLGVDKAKRDVTVLSVDPKVKFALPGDVEKVAKGLGQNTIDLPFQLWEAIDPPDVSGGKLEVLPGVFKDLNPAVENAKLLKEALRKKGFSGVFNPYDADYSDRDILSWYLMDPSLARKVGSSK